MTHWAIHHLVGDDETARCIGCELLALSVAMILAWVGVLAIVWWLW